MKKNRDCYLVKDLLQLYRDNLLGRKSKEYVEKHLEECEECSLFLKELDRTYNEKKEEEKQEDNRLKKYLRKWRYELTGFFIGIVLVIALVIGFCTVVKVLKVTGRVDETVNESSEYGNQKFKGFSKLLLFPQKDKINGDIKDYFYQCKGERVYQNYQIYLCVEYSEDEYEQEKERLIKILDPDTGIASVYTEDEFILPGVYTMLYADAYEYALLDDNNRTIVYIYLQGIMRENLYFDAAMLPKAYGRTGYSLETEGKPYSIYPVK